MMSVYDLMNFFFLSSFLFFFFFLFLASKIAWRMKELYERGF